MQNNVFVDRILACRNNREAEAIVADILYNVRQYIIAEYQDNAQCLIDHIYNMDGDQFKQFIEEISNDVQE